MTAKSNDAERAAINSNPIRALEQPRYVQSFTTPAGDGSSITTMSHAHTAPDVQEGDDNATGGGSVYSYNSTRDISQFVREVHGRIFNSLNDNYLLPTDDEEWRRLDKQHSALLLGFDGLYPCPEVVEAVLAPENDETKRILDLGCGTGLWAMEMANQFPHTLVKGIDVAPTPIDVAFFPPNFQFEVSNFNGGLSHMHGEYDLVHIRCALSGVKDIEAMMRDVQLCLKPGGILIVISGDTELEDGWDHKAKMAKLDGDEDVNSVGEDGSWTQRLAWEATQASRMGSDGRRAVEIVDLGLWDRYLLDPETAVAGNVYMPIGPWAQSNDQTEDQMLKYAGVLMQQVIMNVHRAYHPILRKHGIPEDTLNEWSRRADEELKAMKPQLWVRFRFCWARRRTEENQPAPPLPVILSNPVSSAFDNLIPPGRNRYPAIVTYHTPEEASEARQKRLDSIGVRPEPAVKSAAAAMQQANQV